MSCTKLYQCMALRGLGFSLALFRRIQVILGCDTMLLGEWVQFDTVLLGE